MSELQKGESVVLFGAEHEFATEVVDSIGRIGARVVLLVPCGPMDWNTDGLPSSLPGSIPREMFINGYCVPRSNPGLRKERVDLAEQLGFGPVRSVIDPTSVISPRAVLGAGLFVAAGAVIGAHAHIGNHVFVNRLAGIGHHAVLEDFVSVGPGATITSRVRIGRGTVVGAGATVAPDVTIGSNVLITVGAVVGKNLPSNVLVAGNPA